MRTPAVLWWSNNPTAPTGYGGQTKAVVERLMNAGHPVAIASNWGTEGTMSSWTADSGVSIPVYPRGYDGYSQDVIVSHFQDWKSHQDGKPTVLVTLYDVWVLANPRLADVEHILSWVPIDHLPAPAPVAAWCANPNVTPVAMSKFGQQQLAARDIESVYIPHTIEDVFHPTKDDTGMMNVPDDTFVVMINAANKGGQSGHARKDRKSVV